MAHRWLRGLFGGAVQTAVFETVIVVGLYYFHPFAIFPESTIDTWYGVATQFLYKPRGQGHIAVVLIDQDTLDAYQHDWPLTYRDLAGMAHQIACAGGIGVFFDIVPARQYNLAEGANILLGEAFNTGAAALRCANGAPAPWIPIYFARAPNVQSPVAAALARQGRLFSVETISGANSYAAAATEFPDNRPDSGSVTPAFGLLREYCGIGAEARYPHLNWCPADAVTASHARAAIFLTWNGNTDPGQGQIADASGCERVEGGTLRRLIAGISLLNSEARRCPPLLTLVGADLSRDMSYIRSHGINPASLLAGRVVFVGVALSATNDTIVSPVQQQLPGVYSHAMAFENLLTYGTNYDHQPDWQFKLAFVVGFVAFTELLLAVFLEEDRSPDKKDSLSQEKEDSSEKQTIRFLLWRMFGFVAITLLSLAAGAVILRFLLWPRSFLVSLAFYVGGTGVLFEFPGILADFFHRSKGKATHAQSK